MNYTEIHIWGDSVARGIVYNQPKQRYAISKERCTNRLQQAFSCPVVNHAMMGATIRDGQEAFSHFSPVPGALCAIGYGGNDCDPDWDAMSMAPGAAVQARVPLEEYKTRLTAFVQAVRRESMIPLLLTPLPIHAQRYYAWVCRERNAKNVLTSLGDLHHIYRWQERYVLAMWHVAKETGCELMDLRERFLALDDFDSLYCRDGIHPSEKGYQALSQIVLDEARLDKQVPWREAVGA